MLLPVHRSHKPCIRAVPHTAVACRRSLQLQPPLVLWPFKAFFLLTIPNTTTIIATPTTIFNENICLYSQATPTTIFSENTCLLSEAHLSYPSTLLASLSHSFLPSSFDFLINRMVWLIVALKHKVPSDLCIIFSIMHSGLWSCQLFAVSSPYMFAKFLINNPAYIGMIYTIYFLG